MRNQSIGYRPAVLRGCGLLFFLIILHGGLLSAQDISFISRQDFVVGAEPPAIAVGDFDRDGNPDLAVAAGPLLGDSPAARRNRVTILMGDGQGSFTYARSLLLSERESPDRSPKTTFVVAQDFDNDGYVDLAVTANDFDGTYLFIYLNSRDSGPGRDLFLPPVQIRIGAAGSRPQSRFMVAGDFDNDGKIDLAIVTADPPRLFILINDSAGGDRRGTFKPPVELTTGRNVRSVATGDFNGDGNPDLATANEDSADVTLYLGDGRGGFTRSGAGNLAVGTRPSFIVVNDFNRDGALDLAVANQGSNSISLLLGDGHGNFSPAEFYRVGRGPSSLAAADFNGDGILDLAVTNRDSTDISVLVGSLENGRVNFTPVGSFTVVGGPGFLVMEDFNRDLNPDIAVTNASSNQISILLGDGQVNFSSTRLFPLSDNQNAAVMGDFNNDGVLDLALTLGFSGVAVMLGDSEGNFSAARVFSVGGDANAIVKADFNRDGNLDLAVTQNASGQVAILLGTGNGDFMPPRRFMVGRNPTALAVGDFNEDGIPDLVTANTDAEPGEVAILLGDGAGGFSMPMTYVVGREPNSVVVADFNRDGHADVVVSNRSSRNVSILIGNGQGGFISARNYPPDERALEAPTSLVAADFDRDGLMDVVLVNNRFETQFTFIYGDGRGYFSDHTTGSIGQNLDVPSLAVADFDGDGILDLVAPSKSGNSLQIYWGTANRSNPFNFGPIYGTDLRPVSVAVADINRDDQLDLVVAHQGTPKVAALINNTILFLNMARGISDGQFNTGLALVNPVRYSAPITLRAFDDDGNVITGDGVSNPAVIGLGARQQQARLLTETFGGGVEGRSMWVRAATTNHRVTGLYMVFSRDASMLDGADISASQLREMILPRVDHRSTTSLLDVVNPSPDQASISFQLVGSDGAVAAQTSITLAGRSRLSRSIAELFGLSQLSDGYIKVTSSRALAGLQQFVEGHDIAALRAQDSKAITNRLIFSHLATRQVFFTEIGLINPTEQPVEVEIAVLQDDGSLMPGAAGDNPVRRTIPARGYFRTEVNSPFDFGSEGLLTGYVRAQVVNPTRETGLLGYLLFGTTDGQSLAALPVQTLPRRSLVFSHLAHGLGFFTGITLVNPNSVPANVSISVYDPAGQLVRDASFVIGPNAKRVGLVDELVGSLPGPLLGGSVIVGSSVSLFGFELFGSDNFLASVPAQ